MALLVAFDLSLGFNGLLYPVLWTLILPLRGLRVPARMGLFAGFSVEVLAGFGGAWLPSGRRAAGRETDTAAARRGHLSCR